MATFTITNLSATDRVYIGDFYGVDLAPSASISLANRDVGDLSGMTRLQELIADGLVLLQVTPTADELASGLLSPPNSITGNDIQEVAAAYPMSALALIYSGPMVAGVGGAPDDVEIYAVNALPYKFRVLDAWAKVVTAVGGESLQVRDEAGGGGNLLATMSGAATGRADASDTASAVATPGATKGLFIRRTDDDIEGEVFILVRRET